MAKKINIDYAKGESTRGTVVEIHDSLLVAMLEELIMYHEEDIDAIERSGIFTEKLLRNHTKKRDDYLYLLGMVSLPYRSIIITGRN